MKVVRFWLDHFVELAECSCWYSFWSTKMWFQRKCRNPILNYKEYHQWSLIINFKCLRKRFRVHYFFLLNNVSLSVITAFQSSFFQKKKSGHRNTYLAIGICSSLYRVVKRCLLGGGGKQFLLFIQTVTLKDNCCVKCEIILQQ